MTPEMKKKIKEALEDYSRPYSTTDEGNLYFCATETMKAYEEMQKKVKPLVEALRFYADEASYHDTDAAEAPIVNDTTTGPSDFGDRAREALKGWEG